LRAVNPFVISYRRRSSRSSASASFTGSRRITAENLAKACANYAADKKAEDIVVLDLQGISSFTDYFVICSGTSEPHLKAIAGEIEERLREEHHIRAVSVDGFPASQWIVLDYMQVIVHVFRQEKREFYSLEDLWGDAPRIAWEAAEARSISA
jgi:ribosome-associated protein